MPSSLTRISSLAIFLVAGLFATHASAQNVLGGRNIFVRDQAVRVTAGYPDFEIAYHMPWDQKIEIVPWTRFAYDRNLDVKESYLLAGVGLRYQISTPKKLTEVAGRVTGSGKGLNVALLLNAPLYLNPGFGLGLLWPGVAATYRVTYNFDVNAGVQLQDTWLGGKDWDVSLNIWGGIEYNLARKMRLLGQIEVGPRLNGDGTLLRVILGVAYKL